MQASDIKKSLMGLWQRNFHLSQNAVELILDRYYNQQYIVWKETDNKLIGGIMGIPYQFGFKDNTLKGLFLIGAVTEERFRHHGVMSSLLAEINDRAKKEFDFTFLIPTSPLIADYFRRRGYFNSFFRFEERYTSAHNFTNDFLLSLNTSDQRLRKLKKELFDNCRIKILEDFNDPATEAIIDFIMAQEQKASSSLNICHTREDLEATIQLNILQDAKIFYAHEEDGSLTGVIFVHKKDMKHLELSAVYVEDNCSYYALLSRIKNYFADYSISVSGSSHLCYAPSLIEEVYGAENPNGNELETLFGLLETQFDITKLMQPSGMARLLRFEEILTYIAKTRKDASFKIYIRDLEPDNEGKKYLFEVKGGQLSKTVYSGQPLDRGVLNLTVKELSELLLRKKDSNSMIMEAFGIPRIVLEMKLMVQ